MLVYSQSEGTLKRDGVLVGRGYSGKGEHKNDPASQKLHNQGPIPQGKYNIGPVRLQTETHGPFVLPLIPDPANEMFGRAGFLIHADSIKAPGTASEGCIILPRDVRKAIIQAADYDLLVVA